MGPQVMSDTIGYAAAFQVFASLFFVMRILTMAFAGWARRASLLALALAGGVAAFALWRAGWPTLMCEWAVVVALGAVLGYSMNGWQGVRSEFVTSAAIIALVGVWAASAVEARWGHAATGRGVALGLRLTFVFFLVAMVRLALTLTVAGLRWMWNGMARPLRAVGQVTKAVLGEPQAPQQVASRTDGGQAAPKPAAQAAGADAAKGGSCPNCKDGRLHELSGPNKGSKFIRCGTCGFEEVASAAA